MQKTIIMIAIILMNCGMLAAQEKGIFTDARDGKTYQTVKVGNQVWMAENLAYKTASGCWYYNDDSRASANFGYLYDWETAKIAAPPGWHLPTEVEWDTLENRLGGSKVAALYLKSKSGWKNGENGKNVLGFSAYPYGFRDKSGNYDKIGTMGYWWSATPQKKGEAVYMYIYYSFDILVANYESRKSGMSVRCVKDNSGTEEVIKSAPVDDSKKAYLSSLTFSEGRAKVMKAGKVGFIDESGNEITPVMYEDGYEKFKDGYNAVKLDGKWGFIDKTGKLIIPCTYDEAYNFWEGLAGVRKGDKWGFIDINNKVAIQIEYEDVKVFRDGFGQVKMDGKWYKVDKQGKLSN